ncbi:MAG TPA: xanthine dehydrogenase accessory protein XdhC, partial [Planctomycetota bacterium]|nr:xanthine dehydrogenase accessory protein XdhC [Planctomycetota bacterium]
TVTHTKGSTPRDPGARMIVDRQGVAWGTIGGGRLEQLATERAQALLAEDLPRACTERVPLAASAGQCCGGEVTLFLESFLWRKRQVVIFGAGHVGQALAGLAPWLDAEVLLVDPREERELVPRLPQARPYSIRFVDAPEGEIEDLASDALVLVMTHSHPLDLEILVSALRRGGFPYLGLIGSQRKWARFQNLLRQRGFTDEQLATVTCPIGVGSPSKEPHQIALSVAAELSSILRRATR